MQICKIKVTYRKTGFVCLYSHLDTARFFERALRRTSLPFYVTQGFNPHPKISYYGGIKLGAEGEAEAVFYFNEEVKEEDFRAALAGNVPKELILVKVEKIPQGA